MVGKLVACSSCAVHVLVLEDHCPHCGEEVHSGRGQPLGRTAGAVLMGLTLAGCPAGDGTGDSMMTSAIYGVPPTDTLDAASGSTAGDDSSTPTTGAGDSGTSTGAADTNGMSSSSSGGTGTGSGTDTDASTGGTQTGSETDTGSTGISPD